MTSVPYRDYFYMDTVYMRGLSQAIDRLLGLLTQRNGTTEYR